MAQWWIAPQDGQVVIDDASMTGIDCSAIDPTVYLVFWYGTNGEILHQHSDRLPVREPFYDLTPYIALFNAWMIAAESATPPISLAQAKLVKASMIDALFASKRQLPISYLGYTWDGTDNATSAISDQIAAMSSSDGINNAVASLASSINTVHGTFHTDLDTDVTAFLNSNADLLNTVISGATSGTAQHGTTPSFATVAASPATGPNVTWPPLVGPPIMLTYAQFTGLLQALINRRSTLQLQRTTHKNNVAALTTVPAVAAYDITTGW